MCMWGKRKHTKKKIAGKFRMCVCAPVVPAEFTAAQPKLRYAAYVHCQDFYYIVIWHQRKAKW